MRRLDRHFTGALTLSTALAALPAWAHVTPNVELVGRGAFVERALPEASQLFEKTLRLGTEDRAALQAAVGWTPSPEDTKIYVGRDADGGEVGSVVFLWTPSQHGPVSVAVAFSPQAEVRQVAVTEVGSEPLAWVEPLLDAGGMDTFVGLTPDRSPQPELVAPSVKGKMSRYYARVIAQGVARALAVERLIAAAPSD